MEAPSALPASALRWRCDPASLAFESTEDVEPVRGVVGQESAVEAVRFGLTCRASGQNVFIAGLTGTGRMTLVAHLLDELKPACDVKWDRCYVRNFSDPFRPRLLSVPAGSARELRRRVTDVAAFVKDGLDSAVNSDMVRARRLALSQQEGAEIEEFTKPFEASLSEAGIALVSITTGPVTRPMLLPVVDGKPVAFEEFERLHGEGELPDGLYEGTVNRLESFQREFEKVSVRVTAIRKKYAQETHALIEKTVREILHVMVKPILADFPGSDVRAFLDELVADVIDNRLDANDSDPDPNDIYRVQIVLEHDEGDGCPVVVENTPTLVNLLGTVDRTWGPSGSSGGDHGGIRGGTLLRADGGYLILDARDVLGEPGAWKVLVRTLRCGQLEIVPSEVGAVFGPMLLKPEPIPVRVRVLLVGDRGIYYLLDHHDPDFADLFKVLAEFEDTLDREPDGPLHYARVLARLAEQESLPPFHRTAVAELAGHGARIASRKGKLTARFGRVADIAREAAYLASERDAGGHVMGEDVLKAVRRTKHRAGLSSRRFQDLVSDGTLLVETTGGVVGQINGLAVMTAGPLTYGFPARITASVGAGRAGIIDIEEAAALSGSLHTKGFHILGGLLRRLLQTDHPLAFSASLAFEQSYGGIDGDSASAAEIVCLLSALTGTPIRQGIAMTGSIDQRGSIQPIGGANEKIEGFYDLCIRVGLTGDQGVAIPAANVGDLMLRSDVAEACGRGEFSVYPMSTIQDALEIATGTPAGVRGEDGAYAAGTLLAKAEDRAREYWLKSERHPKPGDEPPVIISPEA